MWLEPRQNVPVLLSLSVPVGAMIASLALCAGLIAWAGASIPTAYRLLLVGSFGNFFALSETLVRATPLIFTGLAAAIAFRAKLWNIGGEGQLYAGAVATILVGAGGLDLPAWLLLPTTMIASALAGAALLLGPAAAKVRFGVDEVVTTLLLNFVVLLLVSLLVEGPLKDPMGLGWPQSEPVVPEAELPKLVAGLRLHAGLPLGIVLAAAAWLMLGRTTLGFEIRAVGFNPRAARFASMPVGRVMLKVAVLSGACAGLAGFNEVAGVRGSLALDLSPGYGYTGIVVAMLAQLHPLGVVVAAIFIAAVYVGADAMSRAVAVPNYIADVIVSVSLICMLVASLLLRYRVRRG